MRTNTNTILVGPSVVLVPYRREHVPTYHKWMQDSELRELTASEELTVEEEYEMQEKWQVDEDKLTFIILARDQDVTGTANDVTHPSHPVRPPPTLSHPFPPTPSAQDGMITPLPLPEWARALPMIGDVNLFLKGVPPSLRIGDENAREKGEGKQEEEEEEEEFEAEVEIMIADKAHRRRNLAHAALSLFLTYITSPTSLSVPDLNVPSASLPTFHPSASTSTTASHLTSNLPASASHPPYPPSSPLSSIQPFHFVLRISETNIPSIKLFEKLGFEIVKRIKVFEEVEMRLVGGRGTKREGGGDEEETKWVEEVRRGGGWAVLMA